MTGNKVFLILGHPRSGTTFLHRFMLEHYSGLVGKRLEDMVFLKTWPAYLNPLKKGIRKLPLHWVYHPEIHRTGMRCWECDDIAFSIHHKAGYLSWLYGRCRNKEPLSAEEFDSWISSNKDNILDCWSRLHLNGFITETESYIFSKSFILTLLFEEFISLYPNTKALILTRSPIDVVPSMMSLISSVFRRLCICRRLPETMLENIYQAIMLFYRKTSSLLANPALKDKYLHIEYSDLLENFPDTCDRISRFFNTGSWDKTALTLQAEKQPKRQSKHQYDLDKFGLSEEQFMKDFSIV